MTDLIQKLFSTDGFMPHGHCYLWTPSLLVANVVSDVIIFLSYIAISFTLIFLIAKVKQIPFQFIYAAFGSFIIACGVTHLLEILNIWIPAYWLSATMKVVTATLSLGTACLLPFYFSKVRDLARGALLLKTREALRESEELYKQIVDTANEGIWLLDLDDETQFVNQRMADMLGYEVSEMYGQPLGKYMDEESVAAVARNKARRESGKNENYNFRMFKKDGSEIWTRVACSPLRDQHGNISGTLGMLTDITKKMQAEEKLKTSEMHFRTLIEAIPQLVWSYTTDGQAEYCNYNVKNHLGFIPTHMVDQLLEAIHPAEREATRQLWFQASGESIPAESEYRLRRHDGEYRWQLGRIIPLRDCDGTVLKWMGIATDIHEQKEDQRVIYESQSKLKAALQNMNAFLWVADENYTLTTCEGQQPQALIEAGYFQEGRNILDMIAANDERSHAIRSGLAGQSMSYEVHFESCVRETHVSPLRNADGEIQGVVAVSLDITERKKAEQTNKDSQERFRVLSESVPQIIWTSNAKGESTFCNQRMLDYSGLTMEEYLNQAWSSTVHPADEDIAVGSWVQAVNSGSNLQSEFRMRRASDNQYRWHLARALPMTDENGSIVQWFGTVTDIHDQKMAQELAGALERTLSTVLDNTPIILWTCDVNGIITYIQGKALEKFGNSQEYYLGRHLSDTSPNWERGLACLDHALRGERLTTIDEYVGCWFECHYSPLRNRDGEIIGMVVVATDITDRRIAEIAQDEHRIREASAQEASRLKSEFLAHMSHEIRTPLNGVMGMINLLVETPLSSEQRDYADHALSSGDALMSVIDDILDFSKIEAGKLDFEMINFNLYDLIKVAEKSIFYDCRSKGLRLYNDFQHDIPDILQGDPNRLRQVLNNLLSNALKFTAEGSIAIRSSRIFTDLGQEMVKIEISDTGIGISKDSLKKLFNAFTQADSSTTRRFGGTGLGLSISKHLVEMMGGQIAVESIEGEGSCFYFTLPLKVGTADHSMQSRQLPTIESEGARILVADDNTVNRKIILKYLDNLGYRAQAVCHGRDVLIALAEEAYDLILMDCNMPEMDGYECTRIIRSMPTPYQNIPIVALTAGAMKRDYERCISAGMNAYVAKPIKKEQLHEEIEGLLSAKSHIAGEMDFVFRQGLRSWNHSDK
jgi:PAS domain S-box-containing protein